MTVNSNIEESQKPELIIYNDSEEQVEDLDFLEPKLIIYNDLEEQVEDLDFLEEAAKKSTTISGLAKLKAQEVQEKFDQSISDYLLKDKLDFCCPEDHHAVLGEKECKNGQEPVSMIQVQDDECCSVLESSCDPGINYENTSQLCCGLHSEKFICCSSFD